MKNYYNAMKQLLEAGKEHPIRVHEEEMPAEELKKQWEADIEFEKMELLKEKLINNQLEFDYNNFFIDYFLTLAIEAIGERINCENDVDKVYSINLVLDARESSGIDFKFIARMIGVEVIDYSIFVPEIETEEPLKRFQLLAPRKEPLHWVEFLNQIKKRISFYNVVLNIYAYSKKSGTKEYDHVYSKCEIEDDDAEFYEISFKCTLK